MNLTTLKIKQYFVLILKLLLFNTYLYYLVSSVFYCLIYVDMTALK